MVEKKQVNPLAAMLRQRLDSEKISMTLLSKRLGVAQSYLSELMSGEKSFSKLDDARVRSIADYLGLPAAIGFLLAGRLRYDDFVERPQALGTRLDTAISTLAKSTWALEADASEQELSKLPYPVKLMLALMYCAATGENLIRERRWTLAEFLSRSGHEQTGN